MTKMMTPKIVQSDTEPEVAAEIIAQDIQKIADAFDALITSRLTFDTIVLLVSTHAHVKKSATRKVLLAARELSKAYLKKPIKAGR